MDKPISIRIGETKQSLVQLINQSGLPACLLEPIFKDLYQEVVRAAQQEYEADMQQYNEQRQGQEELENGNC